MHKHGVARMLNPMSMAIVGASDRNPTVRRLVEQNEDSGVAVTLVNPRYAEVLGRPTVSSLTDIGRPVDAVLSLVNAELSLGVVRDAVAAGAGGVVLTAAGFGETDDAGRERQSQLTAIARAGDLAIGGPNCNGLLNIARNVSMYTGPIDHVRTGGVAVLSQSGGLLTDALSAGEDRRLGFSYLVATGNEAATDLVDYLDYLIDDEHTTTITMIIEEVRRPQAFLDAAYRARAEGKALVALKLGTSEIGKRTGVSHTGALVGDPREYDAAFRHVGVVPARDLDDLFDQAQLFSSLPPKRWRTAGRVAVLTASGGDASLASDTFEAQGIPLPVDERVAEWAHGVIPTNARGNPLDVTGVLYNESGFGEVLDQYLASPTYDTILVISRLGPSHQDFARPMTAPVLAAAQTTDKRLILSSAVASSLGLWTEDLIDSGVGVSRGIVATARSLQAMDRFIRVRERPRPDPVAPSGRRDNLRTTVDGSSTILTFADAAQLVEEFGVPVAPFAIASGSRAVEDLPPAEQYVVKLANVLHRTEIGAVVSGVRPKDVDSVARRVAAIGGHHGLSSSVVVQPQLLANGEAFIAARGNSVFGPMVLFGLGGVFVEVLHDVSARLAPLSRDDAYDMVHEIAGQSVVDGTRGQPPWDVDRLVDILVGLGDLIATHSSWLDTVEVNPLLVLNDGFAAVDVTAIVRSAEA